MFSGFQIVNHTRDKSTSEYSQQSYVSSRNKELAKAKTEAKFTRKNALILEKIRINNARNMIQDRKMLMEMHKDEIKFIIQENVKAQDAI
jgi:hypothetical protein